MVKRTFNFLNMGSTNDSSDLTSRARVRDAAIELFAAVGFERATVKAIAAAAGVSPGLVIHHFGSKDELRSACDNHVIASLIDEPFGSVAAPAPDLMQALLARATASRAEFNYLTRLLASPGAAGDTLFTRLVASTERNLAAGREAGTIQPATDPGTTALIVTAFGLAQFLLRDRFAQSLGADPASPEGASRLTVPTLEILTEGLYATPELLNMARTGGSNDNEDGPGDRKN